ncbi:CPBP family intramembrane glutamic endopeptidase [Tropicimonas marinistellae]|uniref:CPBP family intramembrane glutamic endopeptidase n=1 Tax=Tropicimonas marinistellae TaxID=1739787 RepID=UPI000830E021|nr:type II CAAX endopeptidase family protein [Tropicimonas marinistellae]
MRYQAHQEFIAAARRAPDLWRTVAGAGLTLVAGFALFQLVFAIVSNVIGPDATQALADATTFDRDSALATLYGLFTFGFFVAGLAMALQGLHGRSLATLFGPWEAVVSDFIRVFLGVGALMLFLMVVLPQDVETVRNPEMSRRTWLLLLPLSMSAVLVQATTEELFFRGYLQQQLAVRFPELPVWLILPSFLFGLAHFSPGLAGANATLFAAWAILFGLAAADLTARTGSIGAALAFHAVNNVAAVLLVSLDGPGSGLALYHLPMAMDDPRIAAMILPECAITLCGWLVARLALKV